AHAPNVFAKDYGAHRPSSPAPNGWRSNGVLHKAATLLQRYMALGSRTKRIRERLWGPSSIFAGS
ncbi:hypothetical protein V5H42_25760, partial [Salmonella enterica]